MKRRKNIAVFVGILDNNYSDSIMRGAIAGARECGNNIITFPMELLGVEYAIPELNEYKYQYNTLSSFMNNESIDGIVVEYGSITSFLDDEGKKAFINKIGNMPAVLIAEQAEGFASICTDNEGGLVEMLEHLINDHKYTKIGFISGPKENYDATLRKNVYVSVLKKYGLYNGDDWIVYGDFSEYIEKQIASLYTQHPDMEVVVCANDHMAVGAASYFKKIGKKPGKDIFITGFDNLAVGFIQNPSLTTVKADPNELSRLAVHKLNEDELKKENYVVGTKMVRRESCGCCDFDPGNEINSIFGISTDWREMVRHQIVENNSRHGVERELGSMARELVFTKSNHLDRCEAILEMMRRFKFKSFAIGLYDEFISNKKGDEWIVPKNVNIVGYYNDIETDYNHIFEKGKCIIPTNDLFDLGPYLYEDRHEVIVLPLFFGEMQIGLISVESDPDQYLYAYDIAGQISNIFYTIDSIERQSKLKTELENANNAKSHFLANMSHEIRTPINAIIGFNEMIIQENLDDNIADYATDVKNAASALLMLVNDTLDFSKIDAGKMELIMSEYNLNVLLNNIYSMMVSRANAKGLELLLECDIALPEYLEGDCGRIQQILINLISNAIKYTEKGKVIIGLRVQEDNGFASLTFSIKDTGIGIKEEDIHKLFNIFERIEEKRNRNIEGTGLGINIVCGLLSLMNSELKVNSVYGEGSEFSFEIKQRIVTGKPDLKNEKSVDSDKDNTNVISFIAKDANILVVDDNLMNRKVIKGLLKNSQINVDTAKSGKECIEMAGSKVYDMILLDHMMPEMDGLETFEILVDKKIVDTKRTTVIALTANAISGAKEKYIGMGFQDYLAKPVLPDVLYEMLKKYLS